MSVRVGKVCVYVCNCGSGVTFMKTEVCVAEWFYVRNYFPSSTLIFFSCRMLLISMNENYNTECVRQAVNQQNMHVQHYCSRYQFMILNK